MGAAFNGTRWPTTSRLSVTTKNMEEYLFSGTSNFATEFSSLILLINKAGC